jgi:Superinfection immunity protein
MEAFLYLIFGLMLFAIFAHIYFIPSFIAHRRGHHQMMPIFLLNFFLGWSLVGWVAALVWATIALPTRTDRPSPEKDFFSPPQPMLTNSQLSDLLPARTEPSSPGEVLNSTQPTTKELMENRRSFGSHVGGNSGVSNAGMSNNLPNGTGGSATSTGMGRR